MTLPQALPVYVLSCRVFASLIEPRLPEHVRAGLTFLDYGLHQVPRQLRAAVQEAIDRVQTPSLVVLGYGLCGNGLDGIQSGRHWLLIPRTDDCIAIFLGSYQAYRRQLDHEPGTYYLTKGWLESGADPLSQYRALLDKYDEETAGWVMDQQYRHYSRLVMVAHDEADLDAYRERAREVAAYCVQWDMVFEERLGSVSYLEQLAAAALQAASDPAAADLGSEFVLVPPGAALEGSQFVRLEEGSVG